MSTLEAAIGGSETPEQFARAYLNYLSGLLARVNAAPIGELIRELEQARQEGRTVFVIGNGGSAATASHMANDLGVGTLAASKGVPFRVLPLTDNAAAMTALGNDAAYEHPFVSQRRIHYRPGDKLIAISASGNSPNVVEAARWVKKQGGRVIVLIGFDGGELKRLGDVVIHAETPRGEYGPVEDIHMITDHLIYTWLKSRVR